MSWVAPDTYTVGQLLTAASMNKISGDLSWLADVGRGTSFPGSPVDGQLFVYNADVSNGVDWLLKYVSAEATYKWHAVGDPALISNNASLTLPRAGDYVYNVAARFVTNLSNTEIATLTLATSSGSLTGGTVIEASFAQNQGGAFGSSLTINGSVQGVALAVGAAAVLSISSGGGAFGTATYQITAVPRRII